MQVAVYCEACGKTSIIDVPESEDMQQYALDHGDHVVVFTVDKFGALRSVHILKAFRKSNFEDDFSLNVDSLDTFAIVENDYITLATKWDSEIIAMDIIPIIRETRIVSDPFMQVLNKVGTYNLASVILDLATGNEVHVDPPVSDLVSEFIRAVMGNEANIRSDGYTPYERENMAYLIEIIDSVSKVDNIDERLYRIKKAIMLLKGIIQFIARNIDKEYVTADIRNIFATDKRQKLANLISEALKHINVDLYEKFISIISSKTE